jgi:hypothetical protein
MGLTEEQKENTIGAQGGETAMERFVSGVLEGMGWGFAASLVFACVALTPLVVG